MNARRFLGLALISAVLYPASSLLAAPPWRQLISFKRVEANADKDYTLSEKNGPWMIMAVTFSGEGAEADARALVLELRKRYKLPAYIHEMTFDFSQSFEGRGVDKYGATERMKHLRAIKSLEIAVVVGNYGSIDDPDAQANLKTLRYAQPECLQMKEGKRVSRPLAGLRLIHQKLLPDGSEKKRRGPMGHAFITTNPLLPDDYYVPKGVDRLVLKMNSSVEHSLLDCKGRYSVQVAMFTGKFLQTKDAVDPSDETVSGRLNEAADRAHRMTVALRDMGHEAFEFHDHYSSVVCVGSFNSLGEKHPDGQIELDPRIHKIMERFGAVKTSAPGKAVASVGKPKALKDKKGEIPFSVQPVPVEVPRRSVGSDYEQASTR